MTELVRKMSFIDSVFSILSDRISSGTQNKKLKIGIICSLCENRDDEI